MASEFPCYEKSLFTSTLFDLWPLALTTSKHPERAKFGMVLNHRLRDFGTWCGIRSFWQRGFENKPCGESSFSRGSEKSIGFQWDRPMARSIALLFWIFDLMSPVCLVPKQSLWWKAETDAQTEWWSLAINNSQRWKTMTGISVRQSNSHNQATFSKSTFKSNS